MKTLALSTAILALVSGASLAQTAPESSSPTTGTGAPQAPMTGNDASPSADPVNTGNTGGDPAMNSTQTPSTPSDAPSTSEPTGTPAPMTGTESGTAAPTTGATTGATAPMGAETGTSADMAGMTPPEGFSPVMAEEVTGEMLNDVTVYDSEESSVGTVASVMPETGTPQQVIVDVGGFLGIGAKPVALNVSELMFFKQNDGEEVRAYTSMTEEQIKDLPEHEG
ncbi:PRC-barrel domain-containing protein [Falsirhodobacter sp. 20TX0035]|uniref:PRC-barrel domain-containing protein n=1 Tax=Falsirhodobacter sp. 20TX0035 TaxID=3022019 RepID=UPI00232AC96F|nr:PRC-barrel domain-containing protein [Falsirhodobacter sp. 20TX0035]MDB6452402.1 PRC-barrel domain-containing protein [Falsirhodobacter sp. 20TX0035]